MANRNIPSRKIWIPAALALLGLLLLSESVTTVAPGHNKVATLFGEVRPTPYAEGFHVVNPFLSFTSFDLVWKSMPG